MARDSPAGRRELERVVEAQRLAEADPGYKAIRRGWFFREKVLKEELLGQMSERMGPEHYGPERQESQAAKAERIVKEELERRGWTESTLAERRKGATEKVKLALRLRQETLVTVAWIAQRLKMGSVATVNTLLCHWRQGEA